MKKFQYAFCSIFATLLFFISCDDKYNGPTIESTGSPRDMTYKKEYVKVYVDGAERTSVSEIRMSSEITDKENKIYNTNLRIKGLKKKNKASNVSVVSTLEDFTGTYEMDGKTYDVTGEFHGYTYLPAEMEIVVNFTSRK